MNPITQIIILLLVSLTGNIYAQKMHESFPFSKNGKWGIYNFNSKRITTTPTFDSLGLFQIRKSDEFLFAIAKKKGRFGLIDDKANTISPFEWDSVFLAGTKENAVVQKDSLLGLIDTRTGDVLHRPYFNTISDFPKGKTPLAIVEKEGRKGCINIKGEVVADTKYDSIQIINKTSRHLELILYLDGTQKFMNPQGNITADIGFEESLRRKNNPFVVALDRTPVDCIYEQKEKEENGKKGVELIAILKNENRDTTGVYFIPEIQEVVSVEWRYSFLKKKKTISFFIVKKEDDYGYGETYFGVVDTKGNILTFVGQDNIIKGDANTHYWLAEDRGKFGLISASSGKMIVDTDYDSIDFTSFENYFYVTRGAYTGYISVFGQVLLPKGQ